MSYDLADEDNRLEKSRNASFALTGVIAAQKPESAQKTHEALTKICSTIIGAYRVANDASKGRSQKVEAIRTLCDLIPHLDWLSQFTKEETHAARFYNEIKGKMEETSESVGGKVNILKADLQTLEESIEGFPDVFDLMLGLLEDMTEFLKQGHAAEVCRVVDQGKNAYAEAENMLNLEFKSNLVDRAKLMSTRCSEHWKAVSNLVSIQGDTNAALENRVQNVDILLKQALPLMIVRTKDSLYNPDDAEMKELQKQAYADVVSCLDELKKILDRIKVKYTSTFDEDATKVGGELHPLDKAVNNILKQVAKFRATPESLPDDKQAAADEISPATKSALGEFDKLRAKPDDRQQLVSCVKQARDAPNASGYFQAQDALEDLAEKVKVSQPITIAPVIPIMADAMTIELEKEGPKDMLEAAKAMCEALKKLNLTLD
eukprot:TRINITY_DN2761_c0_g1_i1.p1 TRINITY_DN2761_c0_g1~~TRINITY_DN2761_c0_g1_i1.p1  ORF type:complete len:433 (+),score=135.46 TRINITY_DN2761_c0_g1_i1:66-1364(+)